jgi:hypothetical protein
MSSYLVSESKIIAAEPQRLSAGAKFGMDMKLGAPYKIVNTVIEFDEPKVIAWRHFNGHVWRYLFEPRTAARRSPSSGTPDRLAELATR